MKTIIKRIKPQQALMVFFMVWLVNLALVEPMGVARAQDAGYWQSANQIRTLAFDAQQVFFGAGNDLTERQADAVGLIRQAAALYMEDLQPAFQTIAPDADEMVHTALMAAETAALGGITTELAAARGRLWTGLLWGSYQAVQANLDDGDIDEASQWLRLREYRPATTATTIDDPAMQALIALQAGEIGAADARTVVTDDLRDTAFYQLRHSLAALDAAAEKGFTVRAAEWAGQARGYFALLQSDFAAKQGDTAAAEVDGLLVELERSSIQGAWDAVNTHRTGIHAHIDSYQPVYLSAAEIRERGQLLYLFIDLIYVEYKDGVRNGEIAIPIEYQEALTFHEQAGVIFAELRPVMEVNNPEAADELAALLNDMSDVMAVYGERSAIQSMVNEALGLVQASLDFDVLANDSAASFTVIATQLDEVMLKVIAGDYEQAERTRLEAYAIFDAGPEPRLQAMSPALAAHIDELFWQGDARQIGLAQALATRAPLEDVQAARAALNAQLAEAQRILGDGVSAPGAIVVNSAIIVFREGLEAVVIIAALLASMVGANHHFRRPLVAGALLAFAATALTWVIAHRILLAFSRYGERLEAIVSLIAIGVLLLITNWFFHKAYWTDWMARFHRQKKELVGGVISGQALGLILLGFTSIYREGFETVLFLQALVLDAGLQTVLTGVGLGLLGVGAIGFVIFRLQKHLPYKDILIVTGVMIVSVLVTMVGNTVHVMQAVGWLPITPVRGLVAPYWMGLWLGIYATWQSLIAQVVAGLAVIGSYFLAEYQQKRKRELLFAQAKHKHLDVS